MGKIVMPKNSALLNEIEAVLKIYYEADGWLPNDVYKERLKALIGDDQYSSSYTKKAQITSYFGFTIWEDINNAHSKRRITESGKRMYEAIKANNKPEIQSILMNALETTTFGRSNFGCPDSNSDVEPPSLFVRASLDLKYLTYKEFAYLLWKLEDIGANYTDTISEIREQRLHGGVVLGEEANKYTDCKPIMILVRWGFLKEDNSEGVSRRISVEPEVLQKYESRLRNLKIYNIDMDVEVIDKEVEYVDRVTGGENRIYYGVPGAGKSYEIDQIIEKQRSERIVFHPDYSYSDFVGQILPRLVKEKPESEGILRYVFEPGPFTKVLKKAQRDPKHMYYLVIEEINRGNAPAIFGDIFQLLDRNSDGSGKYHISNYDIARTVFGDDYEEELIMIPSNLTLLATMNTSDQNVFTLDTAFQRRWEMHLVKNNVYDANHADEKIEGSNISWGKFAEVTNNEIIRFGEELGSSEDKRLGAYFVQINELTKDKFPEKVLKYLWDDAFKMDHYTYFNESIKSLDGIIEAFKESGSSADALKRVLRLSVYSKMIDQAIADTQVEDATTAQTEEGESVDDE